MPLTLICRRCGSEVLAQDSFCQECGLTQANVKDRVTLTPEPGTAGFSDYDWPTMDADPLSAAPVDNPAISNLFGQTYDFSNYQLDLSESKELLASAELAANESEQAQLSTAEPAGITRSANEIETAKTDSTESTLKHVHKLHSPLFDEPDKFSKPVDNGLGMRGGWLMVLLDNAIVIAIVCFAVVLALFAVKLYQKTEAAKATQHARMISDKVKAAALRDDYHGIHKQLGILMADGKSDLVERQQALFDEAVFRLGQKELEAGNTVKAVDYFKQVSVDSDHYVRAREMIFQHVSPAQQEVAVEETPKPRSRRFRADADAGLTTNAPSNTNAVRQILLNESPVLSIPEIPEIEKYNNSGNQGIAEDGSAQEPVAKSPSPKFSESEISQYNRLLAEYFSKHGKRSSDDEPADVPSFREWLKQGKPGF